jgi:hypothetical protein
MGFFFEEIFHFAKTTEFNLSVTTGTVRCAIKGATSFSSQENGLKKSQPKAACNYL